MKRLLLSLLAVASLALVGSPAFAQSQPATIDTSGLSAAQIADLNAQAEKARSETPVSRAQQVNEWVEIGQGIGSGLAAAARETGQVVNEFAATPVGQLTIVIILFKVMGGDLIQLLVGVAYFAILIPLWVRYTKPFFFTVIEEYDGETKKRTKRIEKATYKSEAEGWVAFLAFALLVMIVGGGLMVIFL